MSGQYTNPFTGLQYGENGRDDQIADILSHGYDLTDACHGMIDPVHAAIHDGRYFDSMLTSLALANDATFYLHFKSPTLYVHLIAEVSAMGECLFKTYLATTYSAPGTVVPVFSRVVGGSYTSDMQVWHTPTITLLGTARFDKLIVGGTGPQSTGGSASQRVETIIAANTDILLSLKNVSGQAKDIGISLEWYHPRG